MSGMNAQRVNWVDAVKGLTMALVVIQHVTYGTAAALQSIPEFFVLLCEFAAPFRMPLFFLVAGLFASKALRSDIREFVDSKILHFVYFYVLWSVIQLSVKAAIPTNSLWSVGLDEFLLLPVEPFGLMWFLYTLALFFCVMRICRDVPKPIMLGVALLLYFSGLDTGWTVPDEFAHRFIFFVSGVYGAPFVFRLAEWAASHAKQTIIISLVLFAMIGGMVASDLHDYLSVELLAGYAGIAATIMTISLMSAHGLTGALTYIGSRSLYVFLAFFLPMAASRIVLIKLGFTEGDLIVLISFVIALSLPLIAFRVIEHTKLSFFFVRPQAFRLSARRESRKFAEA